MTKLCLKRDCWQTELEYHSQLKAKEIITDKQKDYHKVEKSLAAKYLTILLFNS